MLEIDDSILTADPGKWRLASKMQTFARKYGWVSEEYTAPAPLTLKEAERIRDERLHNPNPKLPSLESVFRASPTVPDRSTVTCELCGKLQPSENMTVRYLDYSALVWLGWCRSCRYGSEVRDNA